MIQREGFQRGFSMGLGAVVLAILLFFAWELLKAVLAMATPFVAAIVISLLLDPVVVRIQERFTGNDRNRAVGIVFGAFLVVFLALIAFLVPTLIAQTSRLVGFFTPVSYTVERAPAEGGFYELVAKDVSENSYTVTGLTNEKGYQFRIAATDADGEMHLLPGVVVTPRTRPIQTQAPPVLPNPAPATTPAPSDPPVAPTPTPTPLSGVALPAKPGTATPTPAGTRPAPPNSPRALPPGTATAIAGNGSVRLMWNPPEELQSGFEKLRAQADAWLRSNKQILGISLPSNLDSLQEQYSGQISRALQETITRFGNILLGSVSKLLTVVLVPIATLYILLDMSRLRARFLFLLPEGPRQHFLRIANDVGGAFGGYLRGMFTLSSLYALGATISYFLCGLEGYALLLGFVAGLLYAVPFVGPAITMFLVGTVSLATGHSVLQTVIAIGLTIALNFVFDNVLTPRIVGKSVGLHPLTTMFSLFLGGELFGFLGMIFAVPLAASIQASLVRIFPRLGDPIPLSILLNEERERNREKAETKSGTGDGAEAGASEDPPGPPATGGAENAATTPEGTATPEPPPAPAPPLESTLKARQEPPGDAPPPDYKMD